MNEIIKKTRLADKIFEIVVKNKQIASHAKAGQFIVLRINEKGERCPLTIADFDDETITLIFLVVGKTTEDLSNLIIGDSILDLIGPLGNPSEIKEYGHVVLIGGGVGVAATYSIAKVMKKAGNKVTNIIGFRNKDLIFWENKLIDVSDDLIICTDDGSYGKKGFVTEVLKEVILKVKIDRIYAIGPTIMMKFVSACAGNIPCIVSLNPIMVDGIGMCGCCRVTIDKEVKFACVQGPEFEGHLVNWDELMNRNTSFKEEENISKLESNKNTRFL